MSLILGIDTGGTFTDAVIFDTEADLVLCKSKRFTTHKDLCLGISNALAALPDRFYSQIEYVHLSTTLATNYILEQDMPDNGDELGDDPAANTGLLNTWIKPIISDWLKSIKKVLLQYDIRGRLYILNSAGTLMDEQEAIQSPTSTLLSGPVASVMGGFYLSDQSDFLVVDMNGSHSSAFSSTRLPATKISQSSSIVGTAIFSVIDTGLIPRPIWNFFSARISNSIS